MLGDFLPKVKDTIADTAKAADATIQSGAKTVSDFVNSGISNFSFASAKEKLAEGISKVTNSFGGFGDFKNAATKLPTEVGDKLKVLGGGTAQQKLSAAVGAESARENLDEVIVKLVSTVDGEIVKFVASPRISENRSASYHEISITHHPGSILKYEKTSNRAWSVAARLISRNQSEATQNQRILNTIRGWVMPYYGSGTEAQAPNKLGAPPPVLKFSGYGERNIPSIPVVLENYDTSWPNDIDYIPTLDGIPFPVIMEITISLKESYSPNEFSKFDLFAYKTGDLSAAYGGTPLVKKVPKTSNANKGIATGEAKTISTDKAISGSPTAKAMSKGSLNIPNPLKGFSVAGAVSKVKEVLSKGDSSKSLNDWQNTGSGSA